MQRAALILMLAAGLPAAAAEVSPEAREAAEAITTGTLLGHTRLLSDDLLEGRAPASRGDRIAQLYIQSQLEALGLEPAAPEGGWLQTFDMVGITSKLPGSVSFRAGDGERSVTPGDDFVGWSAKAEESVALAQVEVVFVGFGIVAPEYDWNDYAEADVAGKIVMVMNNDPEDDPELFGGSTRLYYGRWDYKYEEAARQGAVGAIVIHTTPSAGYGFQVIQASHGRERFSLPGGGGARLALESWASEQASRDIANLGGHDLDALRQQALARGFRAVPLGVTLDLAMQNTVTKKQTANVIGRLPGGDPTLAAEAVIYTAHHDHLGRKPDAEPGADAIYNGAHDNASGVAGMLAVARAFSKRSPAPRRSVLFAAVAAEEQGLLGSEYLAAHPPVAPGRLAANINIDGLNVIGATRDITVIGHGKSSLDAIIDDLARALERDVLPDQFPDRGFFYRSDQFNLAKIGVPASYFDSGTDVIGKPAGWGREQAEKFEAERYHQPSDEIHEGWNLEGAVRDVRFYFYLGDRVANADAMPAWNPGDEFEAARREALAAVSE